MGIKYVPEIQLGHILQAAAVIVTVGAPAFIAYVSASNRMTAIETNEQLRQTYDDKWREVVTKYMESTSKSAEQISRDLSDLRVETAKASVAAASAAAQAVAAAQAILNKDKH